MSSTPNDSTQTLAKFHNCLLWVLLKTNTLFKKKKSTEIVWLIFFLKYTKKFVSVFSILLEQLIFATKCSSRKFGNKKGSETWMIWNENHSNKLIKPNTAGKKNLKDHVFRSYKKLTEKEKNYLPFT